MLEFPSDSMTAGPIKVVGDSASFLSRVSMSHGGRDWAGKRRRVCDSTREKEGGRKEEEKESQDTSGCKAYGGTTLRRTDRHISPTPDQTESGGKKSLQPEVETGERVQRTRVDWEGLVETVFAEEVGDFILQAQGMK